MGNGIGFRIREIRTDNGLTQSEFANIIGITPVSLSRIEIDESKITIEVLDKILSNFDIDAHWLVTGKVKMARNEQKIGDISNSTVVGANVSGHGVSIHHPVSEETIVEFSKHCSEVIKKQEEQNENFTATINKLQEQIDSLILVVNKLNDKIK
ncbi:MAG: helix-turn-helix domain-containing protein [Chitinophagaceae bacterium]|jgi:transcriptional regulator with XRE-family HTH domain|nr:helix-turn-helix domain-containing protein [Chitinophagaceae bacterium]